MENDPINEAIEQGMEQLGIFKKYGRYVSESDKKEIVQFIRGIYQDGWNNCKAILGRAR